MRGTVFSRLRVGVGNLLRNQRGNVYFLTAAALVPVVGMVGSGIDIGRGYMAQLRLQQACDAGVLAGRRAMTGTDYSTAAKAEANKMFNYNYPSDKYGSSQVSFTSQASGPSSVVGTARAYLPTAVMRIFSFQGFDLTTNCTAKLEISNADIMLVLDVTGSMSSTNSGDSVSRIAALKTATMNFFDTMTGAQIGDGRLRFGVVPYSSSANVGKILYEKNPAWLSNTLVDYPSREAVFRNDYVGAGTTTTGTPSNGSTTSGSWSSYTDLSGITQTNCKTPNQAASTTPTKSGTATSTQTNQYIDGNNNQITTSNSAQVWTYKEYEYRWNSNKCQRRERTNSYTETTPSTNTKTPTPVFDNKYRYRNRTFTVSAGKNGTTGIVTSTGDAGVDRTSYWGGCVLERKTATFSATQTAPSTALDMDVDTAPGSDDDSKWKLLIPEIAFPRASGPGSTPSDTTAAGVITTNSSSVSAESGTNGNWQNFSRYWSNGWGVCPAAAMKLTTQKASDRSSFNSYINSLQPVGGTYHDAGMVWGVRLLSADGMFAAENATAPNLRPISRHIIFMTDGEMAPNMGNFSFQGYEWIAKRVGGTSDSDLATRHNNRFLQLCEKAKAKNITVWVVGFGVTLNDQLNKCASPGKAYQANNASQLSDNFQAIARQISKLRLSE
ncbi:MAG: pilus assembly protein TadG-related protein [Sphingopyxis sp.]|nr:pilus assembly protein TadG-related protein [Sphingopyxis sp.]